MPALPLLIEPEQLQANLGASGLLILDLSKPEIYGRVHIPGAINVPYSRIVAVDKPVMGLLPDAQSLSELFSELGLTPDTHVVAYDEEGGGKAARLLWTLDNIGHEHYSMLNGGITAWAAEQRPTATQSVTATRKSYKATITGRGMITHKDILKHLDDPDYALLDARTPEEYSGVKCFAERCGHIPGAVNLNWVTVIDQARHLRLKPREALEKMLQSLSITPDKSVVTYCQTHHRSALLYFVLRYLGYPKVMGYPGSWSDWGNRADTPIVSGN